MPLIANPNNDGFYKAVVKKDNQETVIHSCNSMLHCIEVCRERQNNLKQIEGLVSLTSSFLIKNKEGKIVRYL